MNAAHALLAFIALFQAGDDPAPLRPVDGIEGFETESVIEFDGVDGRPHGMVATYVFPERTRWRIFARDGGEASREFYYRYGSSVWYVPSASATSIVFDGVERDTTVMQMAVRRAVMHYPHGFEWSEPEAGIRRATVRLGGAEDARVLGTLEARLDGERIRAVLGVEVGGGPTDELEVLAWQEIRERSWPSELRLTSAGTPVWRERILSVRTRLTNADRFFQPIDRLALEPGSALPPGVETCELKAFTARTHEVSNGDSFAAALEAARGWIEAATRELGATGAVDPVPCFELDDDGRPTRCLVRLARFLPSPPEGWSNRWERPGLGLVLSGTPDLDPERIARLRRAAPRGERGGTPYCRVLEDSLQLYLPLETGR